MIRVKNTVHFVFIAFEGIHSLNYLFTNWTKSKSTRSLSRSFSPSAICFFASINIRFIQVGNLLVLCMCKPVAVDFKKRFTCKYSYKFV